MLGYFPENKDLQIASRHLGLCLPGELEDLQGKIRVTAAKLRESVDIFEAVAELQKRRNRWELRE